MLRVKTTWTGPSAPLVSTFYFQATTEDVAAATSAHIAVATFWFAIRSHITSGLTYVVQPEVDRLDPTGTLTGHLTAANAASSAGTNAGDPLPYQTQGLVKWRTGFFVNGREVKGRTFIPGPTETDSATGVPAGTYASDIQTAANNLIGDASSKFSVWSRRNNLVSEATSAIAVAQWRVLRSRR